MAAADNPEMMFNIFDQVAAQCSVLECGVRAHKFTTNTEDMARQADILISAVSKPGLVPGNWVKEGATVIDVGITRGDNNKLFGDIEFDAAKERAAWITPVPGGVGPMTRVALLQNTMQAAASHLGISWKAL